MGETKTDLEVVREEAIREHERLHSRTGIFLLWQSVLFAGYATLSSQNGDGKHIIVALVGLVLSIIWLYVGHLSRDAIILIWAEIYLLEESLPEKSRLFTRARKAREKSRARFFGLSVTKCFTYLFPAIWIVGWLAALINDVKL